MHLTRIGVSLMVGLALPVFSEAAHTSHVKKSEMISSKENVHHLRSFSMSGPKGWSCVDDKSQLPGKIELIFVGIGKGGFTPSINVAMEKTEMNLAQYIQLAKEYHLSQKEKQGKTTCHSLGKIRTQSGEAEVLQIDRDSSFGPVRFIQASLIKEGMAYVITATCLTEEFSLHSPHFFHTIQSFVAHPGPSLNTGVPK